MYRGGNPGAGRCTHGIPRVLFGGDGHAAVPGPLIGFQHPGRPASKAPIEKQLYSTDDQPVRPIPASNPLADQARKRRHGRVEQHSQTKPSRGLEALEGRECLHGLHVVNPG